MSLPPLSPELEVLLSCLPKAPYSTRLTEQIEAYGQACYEQALLDAMNKTLPFGKTGAVIAAAIRSLK